MSSSVSQSKTKVGIILASNTPESVFLSRIVPIIIQYMQNPDVQFIFPSKPVFLLRYMQNRKYRDCTVYLKDGETVNPIITKMGYAALYLPTEQISITIEEECNVLIRYDDPKDGVKMKVRF